jgi:UPF0271 protein
VQIDLNADVGEALTPIDELVELALTRVVSSVNVACGAHAGDIASMRRLVTVSHKAGLNVGAHPGYPDREHRGRRPMALPAVEVFRFVREQIALLADVARAAGARLSHVKPHGALYNQAAVDRPLADAVAAAVRDFDSTLRLIAPCRSRLVEAGVDAGLDVWPEAFVDRAYLADGSLVPRSEPGAVIADPEPAAARAVQLVLAGTLPAVGGEPVLQLRPRTLCVHADTPGAVLIAQRVRAALVERGVGIGPEPLHLPQISGSSA